MHASAAAAVRPTRAPVPAPVAGFRPDIQGLRAVAVGVVLLYHANFPFMPGGFVGVDVFFVISGYLITGLLLREALRTGRVRLMDFYARRIRRILPAATVVLVATLLLTVLILPRIRWQQIGIEAGGAALYIVNWIFAGTTDYLNADLAASPIRHFWTLSVEEQFYIVWPLLLVALLALLRRRGGRHAPASAVSRSQLSVAAGAGALLILVPSLLWSIRYTADAPAPAYFVTTTRLWELAIGAALAVFAHFVERIPDWFGRLLGWAGLAGIVAASLWYDSTAPAFPGAAALLPTLSTAAVIAGGMGGRAGRGVGRLLSLGPMRWIGDISYSLYLWHWPLVVFGTYLLGGELRARWGLAIVLLSVLPAWLSYRYIEIPFRDWNRVKRSVAASLRAGGLLVAATVAAAATVGVAPKATAPVVELGDRKLGAEALTDDFSDDSIASFSDAGRPVDVVADGFLPAAIDAREDYSVVYRNGCSLRHEHTEPNGCVFGDEESDDTVMLVGDSHTINWIPTMIELAEEHDWRLVTHTKAACSFADVPQARDGVAYEECDSWNRALIDEIDTLDPDLIITAGATTRAVMDSGEVAQDEHRVRLLAEGLGERWEQMDEAGIPVLVIKDTPMMASDAPECASAYPDRLTVCATPRGEALDERVFPELEAAADADVELIDMNNWVCPDPHSCAVVIGNVFVWRDSHHLTATYAETLAEPLEAKLRGTEAGAEILFDGRREISRGRACR